MGGFLTGIEGILNSPAAQQLIPAVAGAAGSFLSTPRGGGLKAEIGNALQGGARGYETGLQNQKEDLENQVLQQKVNQMKLIGNNQAAIAKALPSWLKDVPDDQKPVITALMTSGDPTQMLQGRQMITAIAAKPQAIKELQKLNPALTPDFLQTQDPVELSQMIVDQQKQKPEDTQVGIQAYIAAHPDDYKKNPAKTTWDAYQAVKAVAPEARSEAELKDILARGEQSRETVIVKDENRPRREPKSPGTYWDPKQNKNVLADPDSALARGLEPAHEKGGDEPGKEAKDAASITEQYQRLNGTRPAEGYFNNDKRDAWDAGLRARGVDPNSGELIKGGGKKETTNLKGVTNYSDDPPPTGVTLTGDPHEGSNGKTYQLGTDKVWYRIKG